MVTKILSLNIWGGRRLESLLSYIDAMRDVDIICLQEVFGLHVTPLAQLDAQDCASVYDKLIEALPDHQAFFCPIVDRSYGLAAFIKSKYSVLRHERHLIHRCQPGSDHGLFHDRVLQLLDVAISDQNMQVMNIHGLVNGHGKTDSSSRLEQTRAILSIAGLDGKPTILLGDFNLTLNTACIALIERQFTNLVRQYSIQSTRSAFYSKPDRYADYIFLSPQLRCVDFAVPDHDVSDHLPLLCSFTSD